MKDIFKNGGDLSQIIPGFEFRAEQLHMADFIRERLDARENAVIEAGTGTGKTLAYLIPALIHAKDNSLKVGVTTETKALQKQLMEKDLPVVSRLFSEKLCMDFTYSLCLGSSNYACYQRYEAAVRRGIFDKKDLARLSELRARFTSGKVFTRFDVSLPGRIWSEIAREAEGCAMYRCPRAQHCPYQKARKEWMSADLLIMNHYLYFTHIASGKSYLPQTDIMIFDEAHSVEDIASAQLGFDCSSALLRDILDRFYSSKRKVTLLGRISDESKKESAVNLWNDILKTGVEFFDSLRDRLPNGSMQQRMKKPLQDGGFAASMNTFLNLLSEVEDDFDDEFVQMDFDLAKTKLLQFSENIHSFTELSKKSYVYWIEGESGALIADIHCKGQPIIISDIMKRDVMSQYDSALFVSATLSINGDFSYTSFRLGMERYKTLTLPSPFDYLKQSVLYLERSLPGPGDPKFIRQAAERTADIINIVGGNCLILFTSYRMLDQIRAILADLITNRIYSQGDLPSQEAVSMYTEDDGSVLMGTHSFWQGIDLPGDLLRCVIMMRLPFAVPDSPPVQAKMDMIEAQGKKPFFAYQIPEAVIKFKQGFGRLIRTRDDRGIVAVLDPRLLSKSYGTRFISSLPKCRTVSQMKMLKEAYADITAEKTK